MYKYAHICFEFTYILFKVIKISSVLLYYLFIRNYRRYQFLIFVTNFSSRLKEINLNWDANSGQFFKNGTA